MNLLIKRIANYLHIIYKNEDRVNKGIIQIRAAANSKYKIKSFAF